MIENKTLSLKYMGFIKDANQWCILEQAYFACNLTKNKRWTCRLSYLKEHTPIRRNDSLGLCLNKLADNGWLEKKPFGEPIKLRGSNNELKQRFQYTVDQTTIENKFQGLIRKADQSDKGTHTESGPVTHTESGPVTHTESGPVLIRKADHIGNIGNLLGNSLGKPELKKKVSVNKPITHSVHSEELQDLIDTVTLQRVERAKHFGWPDTVTYNKEAIERDAKTLLNQKHAFDRAHSSY